MNDYLKEHKESYSEKSIVINYLDLCEKLVSGTAIVNPNIFAAQSVAKYFPVVGAQQDAPEFLVKFFNDIFEENSYVTEIKNVIKARDEFKSFLEKNKEDVATFFFDTFKKDPYLIKNKNVVQSFIASDKFKENQVLIGAIQSVFKDSSNIWDSLDQYTKPLVQLYTLFPIIFDGISDAFGHKRGKNILAAFLDVAVKGFDGVIFDTLEKSLVNYFSQEPLTWLCPECQKKKIYTRVTIDKHGKSNCPLHEDIAQEILVKGDNRWNCSECKKKVDAIKGFRLISEPKILIIALKRFESIWDEKEAKMVSQKLTHKVDCPLILSLKIAAPEEKIVHYELVAISDHGGGTGGGHYIAYAKDVGQKWYQYDDSRVTEEKNITSVTSSAKPYILFYIKSDQAIVPQGAVADIAKAEGGESAPPKSESEKIKEALEKEKEEVGVQGKKASSGGVEVSAAAKKAFKEQLVEIDKKAPKNEKTKILSSKVKKLIEFFEKWASGKDALVEESIEKEIEGFYSISAETLKKEGASSEELLELQLWIAECSALFEAVNQGLSYKKEQQAAVVIAEGEESGKPKGGPEKTKEALKKEKAERALREKKEVEAKAAKEKLEKEKVEAAANAEREKIEKEKLQKEQAEREKIKNEFKEQLQKLGTEEVLKNEQAKILGPKVKELIDFFEKWASEKDLPVGETIKKKIEEFGFVAKSGTPKEQKWIAGCLALLEKIKKELPQELEKTKEGEGGASIQEKLESLKKRLVELKGAVGSLQKSLSQVGEKLKELNKKMLGLQGVLKKT